MLGFFTSESWEDKKKAEEEREKWLAMTEEEKSKEIENMNNTDYTLLECKLDSN